MRTWAVLLILAGLPMFSTFSFADEIKIPFAVKENCFKEAMQREGYLLDGTDDSQGSAGFKDGEFTITLYKKISDEDFMAVKKACFECIRK